MEFILSLTAIKMSCTWTDQPQHSHVCNFPHLRPGEELAPTGCACAALGSWTGLCRALPGLCSSSCCAVGAVGALGSSAQPVLGLNVAPIHPAPSCFCACLTAAVSLGYCSPLFFTLPTLCCVCQVPTIVLLLSLLPKNVCWAPCSPF